jgi:hypothetical protein
MLQAESHFVLFSSLSLFIYSLPLFFEASSTKPQAHSHDPLWIIFLSLSLSPFIYSFPLFQGFQAPRPQP